MRRRKRNPSSGPKPAPAKYRPATPTAYTAPLGLAGKYSGPTAPAKPAPLPTPPEPKQMSYVPHLRPGRRRSEAELAKVEALARREAAARAVVHTVMPGHKQGYQLVTDPELVKQMGKKTA